MGLYWVGLDWAVLDKKGITDKNGKLDNAKTQLTIK